MTRLALRTHVEGTSDEEIEKAATLFESAGDNKAASLLWLSLARLNASSNKFEEAVRYATLSQYATPSENALAALVILNIKSSESSSRWISQLQANYPDNELSQVSLCLIQIESFENAIPPPCQRVNWILERATSSKQAYEKLSKQIQTLPNDARLNIKKYGQDLAKRAAERGKYQLDLEDIDRRKSEAVRDALIQGIIELLPLPQSGDTLETYLTREGICLMPGIRWVCAAGALSGPAFDMLNRRKQLDEPRELTLKLIGFNDYFTSLDQKQIAYWRSSKPLEELKAAKNDVLPTFRNNVTETISAKSGSVGLSFEEAISLVTT